MMAVIAGPRTCLTGIEACAGSLDHHFNDELIATNLEPIFVPKPFTELMIARLMPAAIKPYSIAVAADSSAANLRIVKTIDAALNIRSPVISRQHV